MLFLTLISCTMSTMARLGGALHRAKSLGLPWLTVPWSPVTSMAGGTPIDSSWLIPQQRNLLKKSMIPIEIYWYILFPAKNHHWSWILMIFEEAEGMCVNVCLWICMYVCNGNVNVNVNVMQCNAMQCNVMYVYIYTLLTGAKRRD